MDILAQHPLPRSKLEAGRNTQPQLSAPASRPGIRRFGTILCLFAVGALVACGPEKPLPDRITLQKVDFGDVPGWRLDDHAAALQALAKSCETLSRKSPTSDVGRGDAARKASAWIKACVSLPGVTHGDKAAARRFLERWFIPYKAGNNGDQDGLFTGYFEPELNGSRTRKGRYAVPLHMRPKELVTVDLGRFRAGLAGERVAGKVVVGRLEPFPARSKIVAGALADRNLELVWVDDAIELFFMHIQGSGRIVLEDGTMIRVGYDGWNGHSYTSIGRVLVKRGEIALKDASLQSIERWLRAHPAEAETVMSENASYVFFRKLDGPGPLGSQGVALTPGRSLAVDRRFVPLGAPVWLDTTDPLDPAVQLRRLFVAQDTGGAIRGPVRGDVFWGHGADARNRAGMMKQRGSYYLLLPRADGGG